MNADKTPGTLSRRGLLASGLALLALAAGCGSSPPLRLHHLPLAAPAASPGALPPAAGAAGAAVWELVMRPGLPAYLDRDEMLIDRGQGQVDVLPGARWAEPLAEAVPRLLLHDLALLRGASQVWPAPAPAAAGTRQRLRVQLLGLLAEPAQGVLRLQARWTLEGAGALDAPRVGQAAIEVPVSQPGAAGVVQAHRLALWQLAQRIAADAAG